MGMLGRLVDVLKTGVTGKRTWTPQEVRKLIDDKQFDSARHATEHLSVHLREREAERSCLLGELAFQERRDQDAAVSFQEALTRVPGMPHAHYGLSLLMAERGDFNAAAQHAQFALAVVPNESRFLAQLGYCHVAMGSLQMAESILLGATRLDPGNASAWNNLGIVMNAKKQLVDARDCFQRAVTLRPEFESAREHLALVEASLSKKAEKADSSTPLTQATSPSAPQADTALESARSVEAAEGIEAAIDAFEDLVLQRPGEPGPAIELQGLYERSGDPQSGIDALEAFLSQTPGNQAATAALGLAYARAQHLDAAETHLRSALLHEPDRADLVLALGQTISARGHYEDAMPWIEKALALAPDDDLVRGQHAASLTNCCRYDEALAVCEQLRSEGKESAVFGSVLSYLGRFDEAKAWLDDALKYQPNDANLHFQRGQINLLQYKFDEGWDDYSFRGLSYSKSFRVLPFPLWHGEPLEGKRIVVLTEQGLGDQVMFASCLPDLLKLGPTEVIVEVIGRISPTIERSFPDCRIISSRQDHRIKWVKDLPDMDFYVPLADLPKYFRRSLADFPPHSGYLVASPERVEHYRERLKALGPGPYIGVSWRGGTEVTRKSLRSIQPAMLAPLAVATQGTFVSLQYGDVGEALEAAAGHGLRMTHWAEAIANLDEFAALISALDLVITVCNTTVHYAGALGKPVWVLSPEVPEWRYGLEGDVMPWYPSSRMFRQMDAGNWAPTIARVCRELLSFAPAR